MDELIRWVVTRSETRGPFVQDASSGRARIDVGNIGEALETLGGPAAP